MIKTNTGPTQSSLNLLILANLHLLGLVFLKISTLICTTSPLLIHRSALFGLAVQGRVAPPLPYRAPYRAVEPVFSMRCTYHFTSAMFTPSFFATAPASCFLARTSLS